MAVSIKYNIDDVRRFFERKEWLMFNLEPPLRMIATQMFRSVMRNFEEEGTDKEKWESLSPLTIFIKTHRAHKRTQRWKILQDTGHLRQSIYPVIGRNFASVGTNVKYGKLHQFGGMSQPSRIEIGGFYRRHPKDPEKKVYVRPYVMNIKSHRVPARPFLYMRKDTLEKINSIVSKWFFEGTLEM